MGDAAVGVVNRNGILKGWGKAHNITSLRFGSNWGKNIPECI